MKLKLLPKWVEPEKGKIELSEDDHRKIQRLAFIAKNVGAINYTYENLINNFKSDEPLIDMDDVMSLIEGFGLYDEAVKKFEYLNDVMKNNLVISIEFMVYKRRVKEIPIEELFDFAMEEEANLYVLKQLEERYPARKTLDEYESKKRVYFGRNR